MAQNPFSASPFDEIATEPVQPVKVPDAKQFVPIEDAEPAPTARRAAPTRADVIRTATKHGVDPALVLSIWSQESGSNWNSRDSSKGARGGMQVMPGTFKAMMGDADQRDPWNNLEAGVKYIAYGQKTLGTTDPQLLAAGYHAGYDRKDLKRGIIPNVSDGAKNTRDYAREVAARASNGDVTRDARVMNASFNGDATDVERPLSVRSDGGPDASMFQPMTDDEVKLFQDTGVPDASRFIPMDDTDASAFVPMGEEASAPRERTWGEVATDTGAQLGEGVNNIIGAIPNLIAPEGKVAGFFNDNADYWRDQQSDPLKAKIAAADEKITAAGEDGVIAQIGEAASIYFKDPALAARFVTTNLPSLIPGVASAKVAQAAALARGATAARAAQVATTAAGATGAVLNAGGARGEAFEDIKKTLEAQGMAPAEAEEQALKDSRLVAAVGAAAGFVSGKTGLEGAIAGKAATGSAVRKGLGATAAELSGEQIEEVAPKVTTNMQASQYDDRSLGKDVGRTIVETAIGSGPGAVVAGGMAGRAPQQDMPDLSQDEAPAQRVEPTMEPAAPVPEAGGGMPEVAAPEQGNTPQNQEVAAPEGAVVEPQQAAPVEPPAGPLSAAVDAVANDEANAEGNAGRVTVTVPEGEVTGVMQHYEEDGNGNFVAEVVTDEGEVFQFTNEDGATITPIEAPAAPSAPLAAAVDEAAEVHAADPAPMPERPAPKPAEPDYNSMDLPALRERLKYIATQAKASGGWNKMFLDARKQVEKAIKVKTAEVKEASKPAEEPLAAGPFDDRGAANSMMLRFAEQTGVPHEVVEADGKFSIQPIQEASDGVDTAGAARGTDGRGPSGGTPAELGSGDGIRPEGTGDGAVVGRGDDTGERVRDAGADRVPADGTADAQPALTAEAAPAPAAEPPKRKGQARLDADRAKIKRQEEAVAKAAANEARRKGEAPPAAQPTASWVIREKATGKVITETFDQRKANAINKERYEAVPAQQHLAELNDPESQASKVARGQQADKAEKPIERREVAVVKAARSSSADVEKTLAGLPPVAEGYTRLFRAESPTVKFDDVFNADGLTDFQTDKPGARYTTDLKYADYYRRSYGSDASIHYIDVPNAVAEKGKLDEAEYAIDVEDVADQPQPAAAVEASAPTTEAKPKREPRRKKAASAAEPDTVPAPQADKKGSRRKAAKPKAEPVMSVATDDAAPAVHKVMADKSGSATVTREGIGEIAIEYGDKDAGLAHIAARRGESFMERLPDLLANGEVYTKDGQTDRIFIGNERDEAVIRTDRDGAKENWLLSAYEKYPESKQSNVDEQPGPYVKLTDDELLRALSIGPLGEMVRNLVDAGRIVIHRSARTLPKEAGKVPAGVQAVTMPDGVMHLVAGQLTKKNARAVLLHEMFHSGVEPMIGSKKWGELMGRMGSLYRQSEQSQGKAREFYDRARQRVGNAKSKGAVATRMEVEEFAAYAIEEYERAPDSLPAAIRKWVEDFIGMVKAFMLGRYGKQLGQVTPAQLAGLAKFAMANMDAQRRGMPMVRGGYSEAGATQAFADQMAEKYPGLRLDLSDTRKGDLHLSRVVVPMDQRENGTGTKFMTDLIRFADEQGKRITLTPSADFGGNKPRLLKFYKRFGFVENKGRNKDFGTMEAMYRDPQGGVRYSVADDLPADDLAQQIDRRPLSLAVEGGLARLKKDAILPMVPMNYLVDYARPGMDAVPEYMRVKREMDTYRGDKHSEYDAHSQRWLKFNALNKKHAQALADVMHESTISQVDPSVPYSPDLSEADKAILKRRPKSKAAEAIREKIAAEPARKEAYDRLTEKFEQLPEEGKALYRDTRDLYTKQAKELDGIIMENVERTMSIARDRAKDRYEERVAKAKDELSGKALDDALKRLQADHAKTIGLAKYRDRARITELRQTFEANRLAGPYFPLARFGEYFVSVRDENGDIVSFSKFEGLKDARKFEQDMRRQNPKYQFETGLMSNKDEVRGAVDPQFLADIEGILAESGVPDDVQDEVWQRYLTTMPDLSMRKRFIHRKGTAGYTQDALRAFASAMFHGSHQMARLKFSPELTKILDDMRKQGKEADQPIDATMLVNEFERRHQWVMNPKGSAGAQMLSSLAFVWNLAATPAAAIINTTQTFMLGVPVLGTRLGGQTRAMAELSKASGELMTSKRWSLEQNPRLTSAEKEALTEFYRLGLIDRTQSHDLAGVGETGVEYNAIRANVMKKISFMYHHAERINREVTALAAYRMARKQGQEHAQAMETAAELTWATHFDYANSNRPRYLQNDAAKILLIHRQHSINMSYRLFRDMHDAFKGETPQVRKEARAQFVGIMAMHGIMAGVKGLPFYGIAMIAAGLLSGLGEDDDPLPPSERLEKALRESGVPKWMADTLIYGAPSVASGLSVTSRIGFPDLFFRSPDKELEGKEEGLYYLEQIAGAGVGMLMKVFSGLNLARDGHIERGLEKMLPKALADLLKTGRYAKEGVLNMRGNAVVDELTTWELIGQAVGFTPQRVSQQYDVNNARMNRQAQLQTRKAQLFNKAYLAYKMKDDEAYDEAIAEIGKFAEKHPEMGIKGSSLTSSIRTRMKNDSRAKGGLILNRRMEQAIDEDLGLADDE